MKPLIRNLLRLSAYQIMYMDQIPVSAVCNEAVKLAKKRGFAKLSGFINAVLRSIVRTNAEFTLPDKEKEPAYYLEIAYSVPSWLMKELLEQYPYDSVERMLSASLTEKKTSIRCNLKKASPNQLKKQLQEEGVVVEDSGYLDYAFYIKDYDYLDKLKAFREGWFTVQDVSSQLVCQVADIKENDFVVDVCAAPGGKSLHAAEKAKTVSARDLTEYKIHFIEENRNRLGLTNVEPLVWDATVFDPSIEQKADIVIADLPCSGLGVLGKKADIKYKLTQKQQKELVELQRKMLATVKDYVKSGGILIFSTCTVNKEENINNRDWFLQNFDFVAESLNPYLPKELQDENTSKGYLQLLQGVHETDGFFLSRMRRK
jgi:16S rRNA (cytosine967-C5)-methyltransferase